MSITRRRLMAYAVMLFSLLIGINLIRDIIRLSRADERLTAAKAELDEAKQEEAELKRGLAAADEFWLEKQIRNVLKMAKPGEVVVVVPEEVVRTAPKENRLPTDTAGDQTNLAQWIEVFGF